jgi:hypothetical protein
VIGCSGCGNTIRPVKVAYNRTQERELTELRGVRHDLDGVFYVGSIIIPFNHLIIGRNGKGERPRRTVFDDRAVLRSVRRSNGVKTTRAF